MKRCEKCGLERQPLGPWSEPDRGISYAAICWPCRRPMLLDAIDRQDLPAVDKELLRELCCAVESPPEGVQ